MTHPTPQPSRRDFLHASGSLVGGAWLMALLPDIRAAAAFAHEAAREGRPLAALTPAEARVLEAAADRILPPDDGPGAREAGVVRFIDRALDTFMADLLPPMRGFAATLDEAARERGATGGFADLSPEDQDDVLRGREEDPLFGALRAVTVMGMFGSPEHGGNRNGVGWALLGFEDAGAYQPPFGHYDRGVAAGPGEGR